MRAVQIFVVGLAALAGCKLAQSQPNDNDILNFALQQVRAPGSLLIIHCKTRLSLGTARRWTAR